MTGAFIPDAAAIERLANAFFQGLTGGAQIGSPVIPASPPAPWSAPAQPSAPAYASAVPVQPPFGSPDIPTNGVPSSVPYRSFGGASAGSASPFAFVQSRALAPAASQTSVSAPRVDPLRLSERTVPWREAASPGGAAPTPDALQPPPFPLSPFSEPVDLSAALGALSVASGPDVPAPLPASGLPGAPWPSESAPLTTRSADSRPPFPSVPTPGRTTSAPPGVDRVWHTGEADLPQGAAAVDAFGGGATSPFSAPIDLARAQRGLSGSWGDLALADATAQDIPAARSESETAYGLARDAPAAPTAASGGAPAAPIAPVFTDASSGTRTFDAASIRNDFPILQEKVHGRRLIWLDNGATTQKPQAVIDRLAQFYSHENSNVHRGAHTLAARATDAYEAARDKVRRFLGAGSPGEIVFVRGATEGINLVAQSWGRRNVRAGDEIVVTWLEHHANIVPWQQLCLETGARLRVAPVDDNGDILLDEYEKLLGPRTRIVALPQVSNALGTVTPAREMIAAAHRHGALTLVDGAQSVSHQRTEVQALDADFFVLSGHKMFAPTGIGVVYAKQAVLETMPPWQGGGNMIADVTFERTTYQGPPGRFEAGTGNIADAVGLGAAIDYLDTVGMEAIAGHEHALIEQTVAGLGSIPGLRLVGAPRERAGVVSFVLDGCRPRRMSAKLSTARGSRCAARAPLLHSRSCAASGWRARVRPSFTLYNTPGDVEALVAAIRRIALSQAKSGSRRLTLEDRAAAPRIPRSGKGEELIIFLAICLQEPRSNCHN